MSSSMQPFTIEFNSYLSRLWAPSFNHYLSTNYVSYKSLTINVPLFKKLRDIIFFWLIKWLSHQKKIRSQSFLNSGTLVFLCTQMLLCTVVVCCCLLLGVLVCCCVLLHVRGVYVYIAEFSVNIYYIPVARPSTWSLPSSTGI